MAISISADVLNYDYAISGTFVLGIVIDGTNHVLNYGSNIKGVFSSHPAAVRNPDLDLIYNCLGYDRFGVANQGVLNYDYAISGSWVSDFIKTTALDYDYDISGTFVLGIVIDCSEHDLSYDFDLSGDIIIEMSKTSWVSWSKIGYLDFTIDQSNQAGERPMEWTGVIYDILKHSDFVIIYGSNGISMMKPVHNLWQYKNLFSVGTKGRDAQISNYENTKHWFISAQGDLYEIGDKITKIGYKEFLSALTSPVLSLNEFDGLLYIADGTTGYVYSYLEDSFSQGYSNITGYGYKDNIKYITAPAAITVPTIAFTTNVYDFGTRKAKTIFNLEIHTNVTSDMEVAIEYRISNKTAFTTTPWVKFNPNGIAWLSCYGVEFKFKFRMTTYADFTIDQFKINGVIHGFSPIDDVRKER